MEQDRLERELVEEKMRKEAEERERKLKEEQEAKRLEDEIAMQTMRAKQLEEAELAAKIASGESNNDVQMNDINGL